MMNTETLSEIFDKNYAKHELKAFIKNELLKAVNEKWITIHPHGDDSDDYRRIKLEDGETPKEAIDRVYKKDNKKSIEELKTEKKQLYQDILKAKKEGNKELHHKLLQRYNEIDEKLKSEKQPEQKDKKESKEKLAGVEKGQPMSRDKADNNSPNPNYRKVKGSTTNCQTCVVAYEARLRGYNVQALYNDGNPTIKQLSHKTSMAWIDPKTGKDPAYNRDVNVKNASTCYNWLDTHIKKGERYTLEWAWKGRDRSGHIVSIDRDDKGNIRLYDPQNGETITDKKLLVHYMKEFKYKMQVYGLKIPTPPKLLRIDNLDFNTDVVDKILEKSN